MVFNHFCSTSCCRGQQQCFVRAVSRNAAFQRQAQRRRPGLPHLAGALGRMELLNHDLAYLGHLQCIQTQFILMQTGVSSLGTAALLTLSNPLSFAYMQSGEVNRISPPCLPAVAMALVSSNMSSGSLLISHRRAFRASYSAPAAAAPRGRSRTGGALWVPAQVSKAPGVKEKKI